MVLKEEQIRFPVVDASHELIRIARARAGNAQTLDEESLEQVLEKGNGIEETYKVFLYGLLTTNERLNPNEKRDGKDDVSEATKKRKAKKYCNSKRNEEEENDPQYELFLQHLEEDGKSYVLECKEDGLTMVLKYEEDVAFDKESEPEPEPRRKLVKKKIPDKKDQALGLSRSMKHICGPSNRTPGGREISQHEHGPRSLSIKRMSNANNVQLGGDHNVSVHKAEKINEQKRESRKKLQLINVKPERRFSNQMPGLEKEQTTKDLACGKSRNETYPVHVHESCTNDRTKQSGKMDRKMKQKVELSYQMPHLETQRELQLKSFSANNTKRLTLKTSRHEAQDSWIEKCSASEFRKVMAAKSSAHKSLEENNLEKEGDDFDVEILEEASCVKKGRSNPFVSSKNFSKSMEQDGTGRSNACEEFREVVLNVLKKPYDREEYTRHLEEIQSGSYFDYHPDLEKKLKKYRYNRGKRLTILRGFFFWLQNLTQEGAFKPWKDAKCLAVEPPSSP